jgi:hypothetical protein
LVVSGSPSADPPRFAEALARQQAEFGKIAAGWSAAFPHSAGAKYAVAISLEVLGNPAAIDTLRLARRLAADSAQKIRLAAAEPLLLFKFGVPDGLARLRAARELADSLLSYGTRPSPTEAGLLAALAALSGRCDLAERFARGGEPLPSNYGIAPPLYADAQALVSRLALGCRVEASLPSLSDLAAAIARTYAADSVQRELIDQHLLFRPALLSPVLDPAVLDRIATPNGHKLLWAARAYVHDDRAGVRAALSSFGADSWRGSFMTPDFVYPAARLWAGIGDTATAIQWLDHALNEVRTYDPNVLTDQPSLASFIRLMVLRAELAAATHDDATARRWATAVTVLWSRADPELQPVVRQMARYASER